MEEESSTKEPQPVVASNRIPLESRREGLRPRVKPKPKPKSKTVAGIVLPGLADAIQARQRKVCDKPMCREMCHVRETLFGPELEQHVRPKRGPPVW